MYLQFIIFMQKLLGFLPDFVNTHYAQNPGDTIANNVAMLCYIN